MRSTFISLLSLLLSLIAITSYAQVTIGSGNEPALGALLDLKTQEPGTVTKVTDDSNITSNIGGLLLSRVKLVNPKSLEPFITNATDEQKLKHAGLIVHNLNETGGMKQATYQWNGSQWKIFVMDTEWEYDAAEDQEKVYLKRGKDGTGEFETNVYVTKKGDVGIGIDFLQNPMAKLEVGGSIRLANGGETSYAGTMRYNADTDKFQGRTLNDGWQDFHPNQSSFYLPSFNLSLAAGVGATGTIDLYTIYENQYKGLSGKFVSSDASITQVPTIYPSSKLAFLVLDYDNAVITVNKIEGSVMHYTINSINPSATSYINILCVIKN